MKRVIVKNLSNVETHRAEFATQQIADAWIEEQKAKGERCAWGRPAWTEVRPRLDGNGNHQYTTSFIPLLDRAGNPLLDDQNNPLFRESREYLYDTVNHPDQFSIEIVDISQEIQIRNAKAQLKSDRNFGQDLADEFALENVVLNIDSTGSDNLLNKMNKALEALSNGYLETAIRRVKALNPADFDGVFLSEERLLRYINKIEARRGLPLSTTL